MSRFVLLHHECPLGVPRATHWDLMLEVNGSLRTWVLDELQALWRRQAAYVEEIQRHRLDYLEFEGPLSEGRGTITRVDRGRLSLIECSHLRISAQLAGQHVRGTLELTRSNENSPWWLLNFSAEEAHR